MNRRYELWTNWKDLLFKLERLSQIVQNDIETTLLDEDSYENLAEDLKGELDVMVSETLSYLKRKRDSL